MNKYKFVETEYSSHGQEYSIHWELEAVSLDEAVKKFEDFRESDKEIDFQSRKFKGSKEIKKTHQDRLPNNFYCAGGFATEIQIYENEIHVDKM